MSAQRMSDLPPQRIFIASTAEDLVEHRRAVAEQIERYGGAPVRMETFGAKPGDSVDVCRRLAATANALVVLVAHRYGWIPSRAQGGDDEKSITWLEVNAALDATPPVPVFAYLVDEAYGWPPGMTDAGRLGQSGVDPQDVVRRVGLLSAFKVWLSESRPREVFRDPVHLASKVSTDLGTWLVEQATRQHAASSVHAKAAAQPAAAEMDAEMLRYRQHLEKLHRYIELAGFPSRVRVPIRLDDLYVPLRATPGASGGLFADADEAGRKLSEREVFDVPVTDAFAEAARRQRDGIVLLGDPGSGKTTLLRRLVLWLLERGPESLGLPAGMLPVFLPLRHLRDTTDGLHGFLQQQLAERQLLMDERFGERLFKRGNLLLLLDGLDEIADADKRAQAARWIDEALNQPGCRVVVTSRFAGYTDGARLSPRFLELHIRPLGAEQASEFVRNWYRIVETGIADPDDVAQRQARERAAERAAELITILEGPDFRARRVGELTRNPLLLTNMCLVHRDRGTLPRRRAQLYHECTTVLLDGWREAKKLQAPIDADNGRRVLQPVAAWLHGEKERTRATAGELEPILAPALQSVSWHGGGAGDFLRRIRDESGLLTGWDGERYGFLHLGFQEYLTAREIRRLAQETPSVLRDLARQHGESWWQEVALLLVALEDPSMFAPYVRELVQEPAFAEYPEALDMLLEDARETSEAPFLELLRVKPGEDRGLWARQRMALRALERLNSQAVEGLLADLARHPSKEIGDWVAQKRGLAAGATRVTDRGGVELVHVPAGRFTMGSPKKEKGRYDDEGPQHEVRLESFWIGRFAVTNEEYSRFLEANPDVPPPEYWENRSYNQARQPVVGVSWDRASRFAQWAGGRLPSEAEWEYAARAGTSAPYLTGGKIADLDRAAWYKGDSEGRLHPVGEKAPNAWGLYDALGNVWECCEDDWHETYKGAPDDGSAWIDERRGQFRVMRGGSFISEPRSLRAAYRFYNLPELRYHTIGFRVVCGSGG
jgi:formylglycine-generating enzyme required for sulfatase activity